MGAFGQFLAALIIIAAIIGAIAGLVGVFIWGIIPIAVLVLGYINGDLVPAQWAFGLVINLVVIFVLFPIYEWICSAVGSIGLLMFGIAS